MAGRTVLDDVKEAYETGNEEWIGYAPSGIYAVLIDEESVGEALRKTGIPFVSIECKTILTSEVPEESRVSEAGVYRKVIVKFK